MDIKHELTVLKQEQVISGIEYDMTRRPDEREFIWALRNHQPIGTDRLELCVARKVAERFGIEVLRFRDAAADGCTFASYFAAVLKEDSEEALLKACRDITRACNSYEDVVNGVLDSIVDPVVSKLLPEHPSGGIQENSL